MNFLQDLPTEEIPAVAFMNRRSGRYIDSYNIICFGFVFLYRRKIQSKAATRARIFMYKQTLVDGDSLRNKLSQSVLLCNANNPSECNFRSMILNRNPRIFKTFFFSSLFLEEGFFFSFRRKRRDDDITEEKCKKEKCFTPVQFPLT